MSTTLFLQATPLRSFVKTLVEHTGSETTEAEVVSDHLVRSNLSGHDSHGIGMLPHYVENYHAGRLKPNSPALKVKDEGAIMMFDGQLGYGQRVGKDAMDAAIARCKETGVVLMTLRNAHHLGRIGTYGEYSAAAGLASLHFVNVTDHDPWVVPFGGSAARFITNPVCIAMPGTAQSEPIILDMATSRIAVGKVRVAKNKGVPLPDGMLVDNQGQMTTDPNTLFAEPKQSALLPFGEHKGSGIALFCELFGGMLSGGGTIQPGTPRLGGITNHMFTVIVDPAKLVDQHWLSAEFDALMDYIKSSPAAVPNADVMVAGDPERKARLQRQAEGIPVDPTTWEQLLKAGEQVGLSREVSCRLADVA